MKISPKWRQSIRTQLVVWNVVTLAALLAVFGLVIRYSVQTAILASVDRELDRRTQPPPNAPPQNGRPPGNGPPPDGQPPPGSPPPPNYFPDSTQSPDDREGREIGRPRHFDAAGQALNSGSHEMPRDIGAVMRAAHGETVFSTIISSAGPLRLITRPDHRINGKVVSVVQAAYPLADVDRAMAGLNRVLLLLIPFALFGASVGGILLTGRMLDRVRKMALAAEHISDAEMGERLPVTGQDEFADLALTFNAVLDRLETAFARQQRLMEQQRRFTADASHELKTPLTIIKGNTSLALLAPDADDPHHASFQEIDRAADTMTRLVYDLLLLARSDSEQLAQNKTQLLLRDILEQAISCTPHRSIVIDYYGADETFSVMGNTDELVRLFSNLLDNAVRHSPPNARVVITTARNGPEIITSIADAGPGIAPEHLPHLGERFYRADASRTRADGGTGLGLSIAKGIAQAHGGRIAFDSIVGQGTTVRVILPNPSSIYTSK